MSDPDWADFRGRVRRRASAQMALILAPLMVVVVTFVALRPHDYPPGDVRNDPAFWAALTVGTIVFATALLVGAIRELRRS